MAQSKRPLAGSSALALIATISVVGCGQPAADNLLFVSFDTTRADRLGAYGHPLETSPAIDRLAARGALFERAFAHVPSTLPSHSSMFTGLLPPSHGVRCNGRFALGSEQLTLAEILAERGIATAAVLAAFPLERRFGLQQGFELYDDRFEDSMLARKRPTTWLGHEVDAFRRSAEEVTDRALKWLENREGRWFLFAHYFDPHIPYRSRGGASGLPAYEAEIRYADRHLGRLLEAVDRMPGRTLIVFTADHGEGLGDHEEPGHGRFVYNSTLRVPMIMALEGAIEPGTRVAANVGHVDLLPTILELLGVEAPAGLEGRSLRTAVTGDAQLEPRAYYGESLIGPLEGGDPKEKRTLVSGDLKLIRTEIRGEEIATELFDLAADRGEERDLSQEQQARVAELERELRAWREELDETAPAPVAIELDEAAEKMLRSLGYLE
jgi:arylsulfatase A-like enzyme